MSSPEPTVDGSSVRAAEISETARRVLHGALSRIFLWLLSLQWLASIVLCLFASGSRVGAGLCRSGLNPWLTVGLSTIVNGVPLILIQRSADHPRNRYIVGASLTLFYYLLLGLGAGGFDTRYYVFVSLGFLGFYRDWRLLIAVGGLSLAAECIYDALVCSPEDGVSLADLNRFVSFGIWVAIECGVLVMLSQGSNRVFRSIGMIRAQLELERENDHRQLLERTRQLELTNEQYRALLESTSAVPWELDDGTGACRYIGAQVERQWGWAPECFQQDSFLFGCVHPDDRPAFAQALEETVAFQDVTVECRLRLKSDKYAHVRSIMRHAPGDKGRLVRGISFDITTQKKLESELYQAQKLESVGRLAAGVAHEINTPVQFVNDNCYFLRDAVAQIGEVVRVYRDALAAVAAGEVTLEEARERVAAAEESADYSFLSENMPTAVERALEGLERVAVIVRSMKEFSHPNQGAMSSSDINAAIRSTLTVARHEYKYVADIETRLGELPPVICNIGEFNQTFLNILVNAAHAIESVVAGTEKRGLITISTRHEGDSVLISIQDTGGGIPESVQESIFDPFFTTKEVGKGTGQGLAIARSVIVDKHHGSLNFETVPGVGTTFLIRMPLDGMGDEAIAA
jgi:signal transduction histidine kinase